jgi:hypothetical protein
MQVIGAILALIVFAAGVYGIVRLAKKNGDL